MKLTKLTVGLALLTGCTTNPLTGRDQILVLSDVQGIYADADYAFSSVAQAITAPPACTLDCGGAEYVANFASRVTMIGAQLEPSVRDLSPETFRRIGKFRIEVSDSLGVGTASSASGRIALGSGLAVLEPTDTVIAFLIAREMAHVIARHSAENSGASMAFSAISMLLPGVNVIVRFIATTLGAGMLKNSWATQQQLEADDIAITMLEGSGRSARSVAFELNSGIKHARLPRNEWSVHYLESMQHVVLVVGPPPRYAGFDNGPAPPAEEAPGVQVTADQQHDTSAITDGISQH